MRDTDPEDEINQISPPGHRDVLAARADTDKNLIGPAGGSDHHPDEQKEDGQPVKAPASGNIFMPLYQNQGADGFFIVERTDEA